MIPCLVQRQWNSLLLPPVLVPQPHSCHTEEYLTICKLPRKTKVSKSLFTLFSVLEVLGDTIFSLSTGLHGLSKLHLDLENLG